LTKITTTLTRK